jgi:hypothetical protein
MLRIAQRLDLVAELLDVSPDLGGRLVGVHVDEAESDAAGSEPLVELPDLGSVAIRDGTVRSGEEEDRGGLAQLAERVDAASLEVEERRAASARGARTGSAARTGERKSGQGGADGGTAAAHAAISTEAGAKPATPNEAPRPIIAALVITVAASPPPALRGWRSP